MECWRQGVELCSRLSFRDRIFVATGVAQSRHIKTVRLSGIRPESDGAREVPDRHIDRNSCIRKRPARAANPSARLESNAIARSASTMARASAVTGSGPPEYWYRTKRLKALDRPA